jgi:hypothetical protein
MRVALLPTGRTEWNGLPTALRCLFPQHDFYAIPSEAEVQSEPAHFPYDGFTSLRLSLVHEQTPPDAAMKLIARAAQEALGDRHRRPADLVLIVDDLELNNRDQPNMVLRVMRAAAHQHLSRLRAESNDTTYRRATEALRNQISFHLIAPMIEAWFFADPHALSLAGVREDVTVNFASNTDPEDFYTDDLDYRAATQDDCPALLQTPESKRKKLRPKWLGDGDRRRHPKGYLQWLCRDAQSKNCTTYHETRNGGGALQGLRWSTVLQRPDTHLGFLRALLDDLAHTLGQPLADDLAIGPPHPLMCKYWSGEAEGQGPLLLRNL